MPHNQIIPKLNICSTNGGKNAVLYSPTTTLNCCSRCFSRSLSLLSRSFSCFSFKVRSLSTFFSLSRVESISCLQWYLCCYIHEIFFAYISIVLRQKKGVLTSIPLCCLKMNLSDLIILLQSKKNVAIQNFVAHLNNSKDRPFHPQQNLYHCYLAG